MGEGGCRREVPHSQGMRLPRFAHDDLRLDSRGVRLESKLRPLMDPAADRKKLPVSTRIRLAGASYPLRTGEIEPKITC
jgi:hypothetical protein